MIAPSYFPASDHEQGRPPVYFESAVAITVLVLVGQVLELRARRATRRDPRLARTRAANGAARSAAMK